MHLLYVLDAAGTPQPASDVRRWGQWYRTADRIVAQDTFGDVQVSTVFLGIDHNFRADGPPVLWESMIFGGPLDQEQRRYTSRADAEAGHTALCIAVVTYPCVI
jgi:hypothetical protein